MSRRSHPSFRLSRRGSILLLAPLLSVVLLGYLLISHYNALLDERRTAQERIQEHARTLGASLQEFVSRCRADQSDLAEGSAVTTYFAGARWNSVPSQQRFDELMDLHAELTKRVREVSPTTGVVYRRLALRDADGKAVTDLTWHREHAPAVQEIDLSNLPLSKVAQNVFATAEDLVIATPCFYDGRAVGSLLAFVSPADMKRLTTPATATPSCETVLLWQGHPLGTVDDRDPLQALTGGEKASLAGGRILRLSERDGLSGKSILAAQADITDLPLSLIHFHHSDGTIGSPQFMLWSLAVATLLMVASWILIWRSRLREVSLDAQARAQAERAAELAGQRDELTQEIQRRTRIEAELREARDAARAATQIKNQFLANMSHEIRTPLNGVIGLTELVLSTGLTDEQRQRLTLVRDSGQSLIAVVNDILDVSRLEAGVLNVESVPFCLHDELENIHRTFRASVTVRSLDLRWHYDRNLPLMVKGDPVRLRQVVVNLLGNAVKFTEEGWVECVTERVAETNGQVTVRIAVSDSGIGIPAEQQGRIFEAFQQADNSATRNYGGSGLGLAISSQLVNLMGGRLDFSSQLGQGSSFYFTVPLGTAAPAAETFVQTAKTEPLARVGRVLIAEDNRVNQIVAGKLLKKAGYEVVIANNGADALAKMRAESWDLVLMDLQMPVMDGYTCTEQWRRHETEQGLPHLPIIALTAHALEADRQRCLAVGMDDHLSKPINMQALLSALDRVAEAVTEPV